MEGLVVYPELFYQKLFALTEDRRYRKAYRLLACSNASMGFIWGLHGGESTLVQSTLEQLCRAEPIEVSGPSEPLDGTQGRLIRLCLDRGADACLMCWHISAAYGAAVYTQLDNLRFVFLECGAHIRGEAAEWQIRAVRSCRERAEMGDIAEEITDLDPDYDSQEYITDLHTAEGILRQARARQNWKACRARTVGRIALFVRSLFDEVRFRPGRSGFEAARSEFEALASGRSAAAQEGAETMAWEDPTSDDEAAAREASDEPSDALLSAAADLAEEVYEGRLRLLHDDDPVLKDHWADPPPQTEVLVGDAGDLPLEELGFSVGALPFRSRPLSATQLRGIEKRRVVAAAIA